ncbi:DUF6192 family protein [Streptomyces sp. NPDC008343]|uniref:DUF6192 family protein n=1 Tax=Streptomyces sp. NPDC008343 TaxID=3364828 RepID=UPI0036DFE4E4
MAAAEDARDALDPGHEESPVGPVIRSIDRTLEFLDLDVACDRFVASTDRLMPLMQNRDLSQDAREIIGQNLARVRVACEWVEQAVSTSEPDMDEAPAKLLWGE